MGERAAPCQRRTHGYAPGPGCLSRVLALTLSQQLVYWAVRCVRPLHILTGQGKVMLQHRQDAMTHEHPQTVQVHAIAQAPEGKCAPETVRATGRNAGSLTEPTQQHLNAVYRQRTYPFARAYFLAGQAIAGGPQRRVATTWRAT